MHEFLRMHRKLIYYTCWIRARSFQPAVGAWNRGFARRVRVLARIYRECILPLLPPTTSLKVGSDGSMPVPMQSPNEMLCRVKSRL